MKTFEHRKEMIDLKEIISLNSETIAALLEAEKIAKDSSIHGYHDLDELFSDLNK